MDKNTAIYHDTRSTCSFQRLHMRASYSSECSKMRFHELPKLQNEIPRAPKALKWASDSCRTIFQKSRKLRKKLRELQKLWHELQRLWNPIPRVSKALKRSKYHTLLGWAYFARLSLRRHRCWLTYLSFGVPALDWLCSVLTYLSCLRKHKCWLTYLSFGAPALDWLCSVLTYLSFLRSPCTASNYALCFFGVTALLRTVLSNRLLRKSNLCSKSLFGGTSLLQAQLCTNPQEP